MDGRGCEDYRCVEVETDVVSNTSGSARVKLVSAVGIVLTQVERWVSLKGRLQALLTLGGYKLVLGRPVPKPYWENTSLQIQSTPHLRLP